MYRYMATPTVLRATMSPKTPPKNHFQYYALVLRISKRKNRPGAQTKKAVDWRLDGKPLSWSCGLHATNYRRVHQQAGIKKQGLRECYALLQTCTHALRTTSVNVCSYCSCVCEYSFCGPCFFDIPLVVNASLWLTASASIQVHYRAITPEL